MSKLPFEKGEEPGTYNVAEPVSESHIMAMANLLVGRRFKKGRQITCPKDTKEYLVVKMAEYEHEVFGVIYLDNRHCILAYEELFSGTVDGAAIYPREVVKRVLFHNASAVIFAHNHPSGTPEPSSADQRITARLAKALELIDVRVIDHFVVGGAEVVSFAERGLL